VCAGGSSDELLSSAAIKKLTGLGRRALRYYENLGVCIPHYIDENTGYRYYTMDQVYVLLQLMDIKDMNVKLTTLSDYKDDQGFMRFDKIIYQSRIETAALLRTARRAIKNAIHCELTLRDMETLGIQEGYYLRYIPERWMALLPIAYHSHTKMMPADIVERHVYLDAAVHLYGWGDTKINGSVLAPSVETKLGLEYLFIELSSPPMPQIAGTRTVDGGCYHEAGDKEYCVGFDKEDCLMCSRNGTKIDKAVWGGDKNTEDAEVLASFTRMMDDLDKPYRTGLWAGFTERKIAEREGRVSGGDDDGDGLPRHKSNPAMQPMLMPHVVRLPHGVTTCMLPAGFYLCKQHENEDSDTARAKLLAIAASLPAYELGIKEEHMRHKRLSQAVTNGREFLLSPYRCAPFVEPFAAPRIVADPDKYGWHKILDEGDFSGISVRTDAGLIPEANCLLVDSRMLFPAQNSMPYLELQLFVDIEE